MLGSVQTPNQIQSLLQGASPSQWGHNSVGTQMAPEREGRREGEIEGSNLSVGFHFGLDNCEV